MYSCEWRNCAVLLEKNEDICIEIFTDISHYQSSGNLRVGYVLEEVYYELGNVTVTEHEKLTFNVPEAGDYYFYILCASGEPIIIKGVHI